MKTKQGTNSKVDYTFDKLVKDDTLQTKDRPSFYEQPQSSTFEKVVNPFYVNSFSQLEDDNLKHSITEGLKSNQ